MTKRCDNLNSKPEELTREEFKVVLEIDGRDLSTLNPVQRSIASKAGRLGILVVITYPGQDIVTLLN